MDRYLAFGLRTDEDEQIRRGFRDAFARAGLSHQQFLDALSWFRDTGQHLGADPIKLAENFHDYAAGKGWQPDQLAVAMSTYDAIAERGPEAVMATPSAEEDAATIARADQLLRTDQRAYWADERIQELALEARERQLAAPAPEPDHFSAAASEQIERQVAQRDVDKFAEMLRKEPAKYWASPELQRQHHDAIAAAIRETPQPAVQPAAPAAPAPAKAAVSDAARRTDIEALMRVDGGKGYWRDAAVQREYSQVLARLAGEAPPLAPTAPEAVPMSASAEAPPQDAG